MKVMMIPQLEDFRTDEGGVKRVIEAYYKYLPEHGVELVDKRENDFDLLAAHAGATGKNCDVAHLHGMYFTADYEASKWEYRANSNIVNAVRTAKLITVPSDWVAEIFRRDMRVNPVVIGHGVEPDEWTHEFDHERYVLWNKNRMADVCDPKWADELAMKFDSTLFMSTFSRIQLPNMQVTGTLPHAEMKEVIQKAGVYLSTTKETFCIGNLEAMSAGVPILGFRYGGNTEMVIHKVNGYLAEPYNIEDLSNGLVYCMQNREVLSKNAIEMSKAWTWEKPIQKLYDTYLDAMKKEQSSVSVIIPLYNGKDMVVKAITSAFNQSVKPKEIIVVNDGSTDNPSDVLSKFGDTPDTKFIVINQENGGVAIARNVGIRHATSKYVCCLDKDDAIAPEFLESCVVELDKDRSLGIAYTGLMLIYANGDAKEGTWPQKFNYDKQLTKHNQIPTCCVFRKDMWSRLGGYKQRYAPLGAGAEDAEFWLRAGAYGFTAKKVTDKSLFLYSLNTGITSTPEYKEVDWTQWHPWAIDGKHPFASVAKPRFLSHPVRQYDEPKISVIIPVGKGHEELVMDALDSLEAQFFRSWEAIVVWDSPNKIQEELKTAYPYVRFVEHEIGKNIGAGSARNLGVHFSRGYMLIFLDADDWLHPNAMTEMISAWNEESAIIYTDYVGKTRMDEDKLDEVKLELLGYNQRTKDAVFRHNSAEFDCEKAQMQPDKSVYHWCLVTCLIPKEWHLAIGGFDESMPSWEDVDYHWRMAKAGYCYFLVQQPLVMYRFYTGGRREVASGDRQNAVTLLEYMREKYKGMKMAGCRKCGGKRTSSGMTSAKYVDTVSKQSVQSEKINSNIGEDEMTDSKFVLARYKHGNVGVHLVVGQATRTQYGQHGGGDIFLVHVDDIKINPVLFEPIDKIPETGVRRPHVEVPQPIPEQDETRDNDLLAKWKMNNPPEKAKEEEEVVDAIVVDAEPTGKELIMLIPGVSELVANGLDELGIKAVGDILAFSEEELQEVKGIGKARSSMILDAAREAVRARK